MRYLLDKLQQFAISLYDATRDELELSFADLEHKAANAAFFQQQYRAQKADCLELAEALARMEDEVAALKKAAAPKARSRKKKGA